MKAITIVLIAPVIFSLGCGRRGMDATRAEIGRQSLNAEDYQALMKEYEGRLKQHQKAIRDGPNYRCPNPRCAAPLRLSNAQIRRPFQCKKCTARFDGRKARMEWVQAPPPVPPLPPKPQAPPPRKGLFGGIF